jgi:hypothetical protein
MNSPKNDTSLEAQAYRLVYRKVYRLRPVHQAHLRCTQSGAGLRPRRTGRKGLEPGQTVGRVSCGQEVGRAGRSSLSASLRAADLLSLPGAPQLR